MGGFLFNLYYLHKMNLQKVLEDLVSIPSVTSNTKACKKAIDYVKDLVEEKGLKTKMYERNNVYSLLIAKEIKDKYEIIFNGHLDVVPASEESFKPRVEEKDGNRLMFGRGTNDMKGGDAAMLVAFLETLEEGIDKDIALLFTTDEETGGFDGAAYVVEKGINADILFIPDGGKNWNVCTDEKGVFHIKFKATGISMHGSRVWLGDNAIIKLIKVFENMKAIFDEKWSEPTENDNWKPTINLGALNGGEAANQVPDEATMLIDIRYPTPVTQEDLEGIVKDSIVEGVTWKAISTGSPLHIDMDNKYLKKWLEIIDKKEFEKAHGASDARFFAKKGMNCIITTPKASESHIENEWIDLDDLIKFKDKIKEWIKGV
jgi:succinyl-diaminopimelate desuccinylase